WCWAGENEPAIAVSARDLHDRGLGIFGVEVAGIAVLQRHRLDPAVEMIGPAVIAALEFGRVALVVGDDERSAVGALIVNDADVALGVAHQHHRLAPDKCAKVVAGIFDLALVPDIDPGDAEYPFQLELENGRIGVDLPMHTAGLKEPR